MTYTALDIKKLSKQLGRSATVLDFPLDKQKEIAKSEGYGDDFEAWKTATERSLQKMKETSKNLEIVYFETKEEAERAGYTIPRWDDEPINPIFHHSK